MRSFNYINAYIAVILISMSVAPAFALGDFNKNLLLVGIMSLSPLVILRYLEFDAKDFKLLLFLLILVLCPLLFHPETMRWPTLLFTAMFCLTFMAYNRLLRHGRFALESYVDLIRGLIYAFAIVLIVQQVCVLNNWPVFNAANYDPKIPWKLNSLTSEPSYSARIVGLLMYCYLVVREILSGGKYDLKQCFGTDKWVWLAFFWTMLTMMSASAFLFLFLVIIRFVRWRTLLPVCAIVLIGVFVLKNTEVPALSRTYKVAEAAITFDEKTIVAADHSASFRIVPTLRFIKMIDLTTAEGWFGRGIDYVQDNDHKWFTGVNKNAKVPSGLLSLAIDYGFLAFILFVWFSLGVCVDKKDRQSYLFWFFMIALNSINHQLLWVSIFFMYTNKYFRNKAGKFVSPNILS